MAFTEPTKAERDKLAAAYLEDQKKNAGKNRRREENRRMNTPEAIASRSDFDVFD